MALVFAFLYTPLVVLVALSFNRSRFSSEPSEGRISSLTPFFPRMSR